MTAITKKTIENSLKGYDYDKIAKAELTDFMLNIQSILKTTVNSTQMNGNDPRITDSAGNLSVSFNLSSFPAQANNPYYNVADSSRIPIPYDGNYKFDITASLEASGIQAGTKLVLSRRRGPTVLTLVERDITGEDQGCSISFAAPLLKGDYLIVSITGGIAAKNLFISESSPCIFIQKQI